MIDLAALAGTTEETAAIETAQTAAAEVASIKHETDWFELGVNAFKVAMVGVKIAGVVIAAVSSN